MGTPLTPYNTGESKKQQVATMFNNVAGTYDFLNHFFSVGIDKLWRRKLVKLIGVTNPKLILDVATGTADLAIAETRLNPEKIIGVDISEKMLNVGREKIKSYPNIELQLGDSENLQFPDNTFDAVSVAFGVRNFENVTVGLSEMRRKRYHFGIHLAVGLGDFKVKQNEAFGLSDSILSIKSKYGMGFEIGALMSYHINKYLE
ncbi:unnamed protein product, partial [Rotaria sp. Silwood2]